ncbi:ATP-binding protein [Streptomyces spectabilis]|uniref:ATP-binding protein n=1 Tax=Streptomyces spectabilis TaxID=68270 RepID=UPI00340F70B0
MAEAVPEARHLVRSALHTWNLGEAVDDAALAVSELASNAVRHGAGRRMEIRVTRVGVARVRVAVTDRSRALPVVQEPGDEDPAGRGLFLIEALSDAWGTELLTWGKTVWSEHCVRPLNHDPEWRCP